MATIAETLTKLAEGQEPNAAEYLEFKPMSDADLVAIEARLAALVQAGTPRASEYIPEATGERCAMCGRPVGHFLWVRTPGAPQESRLQGMFGQYERRVASCCGDTVTREFILSLR